MTNPPEFLSAAQTQSLVDEAVAAATARFESALADQQAAHETATANLQKQLEAARAVAPVSVIPEHGGGPGLDIEETWSYAQQTAAREAAQAV